MDTSTILKAIDAEIKSLQEARALLALESKSTGRGGRRGRPPREPGAKATPAKRTAGKKRTLSPEARMRIAEAQRKRWASAHASKKSSARRSAGGDSTPSNPLLPKSLLLPAPRRGRPKKVY